MSENDTIIIILVEKGGGVTVEKSEAQHEGCSLGRGGGVGLGFLIKIRYS